MVHHVEFTHVARSSILALEETKRPSAHEMEEKEQENEI